MCFAMPSLFFLFLLAFDRISNLRLGVGTIPCNRRHNDDKMKQGIAVPQAYAQAYGFFITAFAI
jgi:hypothetical protein